ncbi:hypothetical protein LCGC14_2871980, partial [marine sediment metagenome]
MKRLVATLSTVLLLMATLTLSLGCSRGAPVLRGTEVLFKVKRSFQKPTHLYVELARGQEAADVHRDGWYLSSAYMSRIF